MKKALSIIAILAFTLVASGFYSTEEYQEEHIQAKLSYGEGIWHIAEKYYEQNENGESFDAFRYRISRENKALYAEGRMPQPGDAVTVTVMKKTKK